MNALNDDGLGIRALLQGTTSSLAHTPAKTGDNQPLLDKRQASGLSSQTGQEVTVSKEGQSLVSGEVATKDMAALSASDNLSETSLDELADSLNTMLENLNNFMRFQKDDVTGRNVFSLVDVESKEVIKQFPSEEFLNVSRRLVEYLETEMSKDVGKTDGQTGSIISNIV